MSDNYMENKFESSFFLGRWKCFGWVILDILSDVYPFPRWKFRQPIETETFLPKTHKNLNHENLSELSSFLLMNCFY